MLESSRMASPPSSRADERFLPLVVAFGLDVIEAESASTYGSPPRTSRGMCDPCAAYYRQE